MVALSVSLGAVIAFLIVMIVYQQFENYVLQPTIIGKAAKIPGFTVLASVLAFGALFGVIGAVIAVPIAAGLQIVTDELTVERRARIAAAEADEAVAGRVTRRRQRRPEAMITRWMRRPPRRRFVAPAAARGP